jgi:hypothetical protein
MMIINQAKGSDVRCVWCLGSGIWNLDSGFWIVPETGDGIGVLWLADHRDYLCPPCLGVFSPRNTAFDSIATARGEDELRRQSLMAPGLVLNFTPSPAACGARRGTRRLPQDVSGAGATG